MLLVLGLSVAVLLWLGVMQGIVWSYNRQASVAAVAGHLVEDRYQHIALTDVIRYHTAGWTATFFVLFVLLELAAFPLWQLLGFSGVLALVYGNAAITRGESEWMGKNDSSAVTLFGRRRDALWYRLLMVAEWAAYLALIVLTAHLVVSVFA